MSKEGESEVRLFYYRDVNDIPNLSIGEKKKRSGDLVIYEGEAYFITAKGINAQLRDDNPKLDKRGIILNTVRKSKCKKIMLGCIADDKWVAIKGQFSSESLLGKEIRCFDDDRERLNLSKISVYNSLE